MAQLPLVGSGYFDQLADANFELGTNISRRRMGFSQLLQDLGLRSTGQGDNPLRPDWSNRFGAFSESFRNARTNTAGRGFGASKDMRRMVWAPAKYEIMKQANRARGEMIFENTADRERRRQVLARAAQEAARYGYENRLPSSSR